MSGPLVTVRASELLASSMRALRPVFGHLRVVGRNRVPDEGDASDLCALVVVVHVVLGSQSNFIKIITGLGQRGLRAWLTSGRWARSEQRNNCLDAAYLSAAMQVTGQTNVGAG